MSLFWLLAIAAFVFEVVALVDAVRRPAPAFPAAGKLTKQWWLIILGVSNAIGLAAAAQFLFAIGFLPIAAFIAAAIYMVDVRPKVRQLGGRGGASGPYGPW
ncbi:MAG: DUF2516 family protein [Streptosporangiales bacterium]|nr:DUF2516 family protein [Streptosporangiales bacterium]